VGFVVDELAPGQIFAEHFGFPCQNRSFDQLLHHYNYPGQFAEACDELITRPRGPADCPKSSNRNETESFMEVAKTQNWAEESQGKNS
jgi:hypothetical protein